MPQGKHYQKSKNSIQKRSHDARNVIHKNNYLLEHNFANYYFSFGEYKRDSNTTNETLTNE